MGEKVENQNVVQYVEAISVKPPVFNPNNIRGWFVGLECAFGISGVKSGITKTMHLLHAVPPNVIESIPEIDVYRTAFVEEDYKKYKEALIKRFSKSTWQKLDSLFDSTPDVSKKPSEIYYEMQKLANDPEIEMPENVLTYMWFKKLSVYVQNHMMSEMESFSPDTDLRTADRHYDHELQGNHSSAIAESQQVFAVNQRLAQNRLHSTVPKQLPKPTNSGFKEDGRWCFFHYHYGKRAQKCNKEGCKYITDHSGNARQ